MRICSLASCIARVWSFTTCVAYTNSAYVLAFYICMYMIYVCIQLVQSIHRMCALNEIFPVKCRYTRVERKMLMWSPLSICCCWCIATAYSHHSISTIPTSIFSLISLEFELIKSGWPLNSGRASQHRHRTHLLNFAQCQNSSCTVHMHAYCW